MTYTYDMKMSYSYDMKVSYSYDIFEIKCQILSITHSNLVAYREIQIRYIIEKFYENL